MIDLIAIILAGGIMKFFVSSDPFIVALRAGFLAFFGVAIITMLIGLPAELAVVLGVIAVVVLVCVAASSDGSESK